MKLRNVEEKLKNEAVIHQAGHLIGDLALLPASDTDLIVRQAWIWADP